MMSNSIGDLLHINKSLDTSLGDLLIRKTKCMLRQFLLPTKNGGCFLILILAILCHKSLWLTPLDTKKVPQKRPLIKTHISCCQHWERPYPYLYTSIWSHVIRKREKEENHRGSGGEREAGERKK